METPIATTTQKRGINKKVVVTIALLAVVAVVCTFGAFNAQSTNFEITNVSANCTKNVTSDPLFVKYQKFLLKTGKHYTEAEALAHFKNYKAGRERAERH